MIAMLTTPICLNLAEDFRPIETCCGSRTFTLYSIFSGWPLSLYIISAGLSRSNDHNAHIHCSFRNLTSRLALSNDHSAHNLHVSELINKCKKKWGTLWHPQVPYVHSIPLPCLCDSTTALSSYTISGRLSPINDHNAHKLHLPEFWFTILSPSNDHSGHNMHLP